MTRPMASFGLCGSLLADIWPGCGLLVAQIWQIGVEHLSAIIPQLYQTRYMCLVEFCYLGYLIVPL